jgi:hypothetical protein
VLSRDRSREPKLGLSQLDALEQSFALGHENPRDLRSANFLTCDHGFSPDRRRHEDGSRNVSREPECVRFGEIDDTRCIGRDLLLHLLSKRSIRMTIGQNPPRRSRPGPLLEWLGRGR